MPNFIDISGNSYTVQELEDLTVAAVFPSLDLSGLCVARLPPNLKILGDLKLVGTYLTQLPEGLEVGGDLILDDSTVELLPAGLKVGKNLWVGNSRVTRLPDNLEVGGFLELCYEQWELESIGSNINVDCLSLSSCKFLTNKIKCCGLYITDNTVNVFDCSNIEVSSFSHINPSKTRTVITNLHSPTVELLLHEESDISIQNSSTATLDVLIRIQGADDSRLVLNLSNVKAGTIDISILSRPNPNQVNTNLILSIIDTAAKLRIKSLAPNTTVCFSQLALQGDLLLPFDVETKIVLPEYGLVYGTLVCPSNTIIPPGLGALGLNYEKT